MQAIIAGLIRHVLTMVGGGVIASGTISGSDIEIAAGAIAALIGVGSSIIQKRLVAPQ
jgi:hypothetical protein